MPPEVSFPRNYLSTSCGGRDLPGCTQIPSSGHHSPSPLHSAHLNSRKLCVTSLFWSLLSGSRRGMVPTRCQCLDFAFCFQPQVQAEEMSHQFFLKTSSTLLALTPFLGDGGLLIVGGRLSNSSLSQSQNILPSSRDQIILPNSFFCLYTIPYAIVAPLTCRNYGSRARRETSGPHHLQKLHHLSSDCCHQQMGQLPSNRVSPSSPFAVTTGIDYAGPFTMKKGHTRKPTLITVFLAIFMCFSTRLPIWRWSPT